MENILPSASTSSSSASNKDTRRNKKEREYYPVRLVASEKTGKLYARLKSSPYRRVGKLPVANIISQTENKTTTGTGDNNTHDGHWSFFETEDTKQILGSMFARKVFHPEYADSFYHLATASSREGLRHMKVSFSRFQSTFIIKFLNDILHQTKKVHRGEVIPFFKYRPNRAYDQLTPGNHQQFWTDSDLNYCNIRMKVTMCQITGLPVCFINNPQSERPKYPGWAGDTICLRIPQIQELVPWLILKNEESN